VPLKDALKGIPPEATAPAIRAHANSIYKQAHQLLRELGRCSAEEAKLISSDLVSLQLDAQELLEHNLVSGHELPKMKFVTNIHLPREQVIQRFYARHPKPITDYGNSSNRSK
jgi:hypothetical protein